MPKCPTQTIIEGSREKQDGTIETFKYSISVEIFCINNQQIWRYIITQLQGDPQFISNFSVEVCKDFTDDTFIDKGGGDFGSPNSGQGDCLANQTPPVGKRIKWNVDNTSSSVDLSFTLKGCFEQVPGLIAIKTGNQLPGPDKRFCFPLATICTPGCNPAPPPIPPRPPRGIPFSEEENITPFFRSDKKEEKE